TSGPTDSALGEDHSIAPARKPGGNFQSSVVGNPESPGLRQYVCQPFSICSRNANVAGCPGTSAAFFEMSSASTCGVFTGAAYGEACAATPTMAATSHPSQWLPERRRIDVTSCCLELARREQTIRRKF